MKRIVFTLVLVGSMLVSAGSVFASGNGDCDRGQTKLHLRDGSCQTSLAGMQGAGSGAGDLIKLHLRDGSCQTV